MAEGVKETVLSIRVDSAQAIQQLADYSALIEQCRKREQELKQSIKEGNDVTGEQAEMLQETIEARKAYARASQIASKEVQNNITQSKAEEGSLKSLRAELSNLTKKYDEMGRARRESQEGKDLQADINKITKELKGAEEGTQRFYRNVGNYAGSLSGLFGKLQSDAKAAIPGIEALGFKSQSSFGWISVVAGALVGLIGFFKKAVTSSEELSMRSSEMFAFLKTGAVQLQNLLQSIGNTLLNWAQSVFDLVEKGQRLWAKLTGREAEYNQQLSERKKLANELTKQTKEQNAITLEQRNINEKNADSELKIAKLRAQAADKVTYSARQRLQFIKEASDEERRISERNYNLAKREYELAKSRAALAGNSAEENEALSQAYTKMIQQETAYFNKVRELNAQVAEATAQALANEKALADQRAQSAFVSVANAKEFLEILRESEAELEQGLAPILDDLKLKETNDALEERLSSTGVSIGELKDRVETLRTELATMQQKEGETFEQFRNRQLTAEQELNNSLMALWAQRQLAASAIAGTFSELSGLLEEFGEDNKAAAKASQLLAIGSIAVQQGVATAQAIATATRSSATWIDMLVAIATSVGAITSTFVPVIKMVKSAKFSTGGYVSGEGTGTSDSIPAMLSNGESVNNARSTSMFAPIYSSLNQMGGGVPIVATQTASQVQGEEMLARAFAKGMSEADIRVGVDEITRVQNRVKVVENLGVL